MKYNTKITYSTGEFARYFNIKKDTLFYYDKIGLFSPAGVKENGYRYYTAAQIEPFRTLLAFRELEVPIKTLLSYFRNPSPGALEEITSCQLEKIENEIQKLSQIRSHLSQISSSLAEAATANFNKVQLRQIPPTHLIYSRHMDSSLETSDQQWEAIHDDFIRSAGLSGAADIKAVISESDLQKGNFNRISCLYTESPFPTDPLRAGGTYAVYYHKGAYNTIKSAYSRMLHQIDDMGLVTCGDAYEEYLVSETATKDENQYVTKIMIRVQ